MDGAKRRGKSVNDYLLLIKKFIKANLPFEELMQRGKGASPSIFHAMTPALHHFLQPQRTVGLNLHTPITTNSVWENIQAVKKKITKFLIKLISLFF